MKSDESKLSTRRKKISLHRETLADLSESQLAAAWGGSGHTCHATCPQ